MGRTKPEEVMATLLQMHSIPFTEQVKIAGHKIDFIAHFPDRHVLVDVNGSWWHAKPKIIDCDRIKFNRVLLAGDAPFGVWCKRLTREPVKVMETIKALGTGDLRLPYWDWNVDIDSLDPRAAGWAKTLLERGQA